MELIAVVTVPSTKPAPVMAVAAAACACPTTFGTATCSGPVDEQIDGGAGSDVVPAVGFELITMPEATWNWILCHGPSDQTGAGDGRRRRRLSLTHDVRHGLVAGPIQKY